MTPTTMETPVPEAPLTGAELRQAREALGLSRTKLASELGVHWNTINKWERGLHPIPRPVARLFRRLVAERQAGG